MSASAPTGRRRSTRTAGLLVALAGIALLTAACGVPLDDQPRVIARTSTTIEATPTTVTPDGGPQVTVYFLRKDTLEPLSTTVEGDATIDKALKSVLAGPPTSSPDLRTAAPPGTTLRAPVEIDGATARIDLSPEFNDLVGNPQKQAFAQLVFTALEFPRVKQVRFQISGANVDAATDNGNMSVVRASDYEGALNPR